MKTEMNNHPSNRVLELKKQAKNQLSKSSDLTTLDQINEFIILIPFNAICCKIRCRKFNHSVNAF